MSIQMFAAALTVFVLGLFVGCNLGVVLMCILQTAKETMPDAEMLAVSVRTDE